MESHNEFTHILQWPMLLTGIDPSMDGQKNKYHHKVWGEIIYPFPNFSDAAVEVWEWISDFISHFNGRVITYPRWDLSKTMLVKRAPGVLRG